MNEAQCVDFSRLLPTFTLMIQVPSIYLLLDDVRYTVSSSSASFVPPI
jgi:hypothetical protein